MKTLVILTHPNIEDSKVNKRWKQELIQHPAEITVHELYKEYPDWIIDVLKEQQLLEAHDRIIFQFPFYWYSYPPLLKKWLDDVFTHSWAYGSKGGKLKGKKIGAAISIGGKEEDYSPSASFPLDQLITPFKASMLYVGASVLPHFAAYGFAFQATEEDINLSAKAYIDYILTQS